MQINEGSFVDIDVLKKNQEHQDLINKFCSICKLPFDEARLQYGFVGIQGTYEVGTYCNLCK